MRDKQKQTPRDVCGEATIQKVLYDREILVYSAIKRQTISEIR